MTGSKKRISGDPKAGSPLNTPLVVHNVDTHIPTEEEYIEGAVTALQEISKEDHQAKIDDAIAALKKQYAGLKVKGVDDRPTYVACSDGLKLVKKLRTGVENKRNELNAFPLKYQRSVNAEAKRITEGITGLEKHLADQVKSFEDAEKVAKQAEDKRRKDLLLANGWRFDGFFFICGPLTISPDQVAKYKPKELEKAVAHGVEEVARVKAAAEAQLAKEQQLATDTAALNKKAKELEDARAEINEARVLKLKAIVGTFEKDREDFDHIAGTYFDEIFAMSTAGFNEYLETVKELVAIRDEVKPGGPGPVEHVEPKEEFTMQVHTVEAPAADEPFLPEDEDPFITGNDRTLSPEYMDGYDHCRDQCIKIMEDPTPRNRAAFIVEFNALKP